jgi:hypothetical protein
MKERLRIARELHDSLTARHLGDPGPGRRGRASDAQVGEDVPPGLVAIKEADADAARELRATVSVLAARGTATASAS